MWIDIKQWASEAWEEVGIITLTAGNMIADVVMGVVNQIRLILAQGDKMIADFLVSVGNKTSSLPVIGSWFQGVAKEQADVAKNQRKRSRSLSSGLRKLTGGYLTRQVIARWLRSKASLLASQRKLRRP